MYSSYPLDSTKSTLEKMYATNQDLNQSLSAPTMAEPKKANLFQTWFNSFTNILGDQFTKGPAALMNNFSNLNNTLSVTIVPNEGIISQEFFKSLISSNDNFSNNIQRTQNKENFVDFRDMLKLKNKIHVPRSEFFGSTNDSKFPNLDDFDFCLDTESMLFVNEKAFENRENITGLNFEKYNPESGNSMWDEIISKDMFRSKNEIISEEKLMSPEDRQSPKPSLEESPQAKSSQSTNPLSMWQKVVSGVSNHLRSFTSTPEETCTKKNQTSKTRRKANCISIGRGRGRGKSQLRRNGVSQTRHRKKRSRHELCSDIQDDLDSWEEFESFTTPLSFLSQNEDLDERMDVEGPSCALSFEMIDIKPMTTKQRKHVLMKSESFSMKVNYVPECSLEEREANCTINKTTFRTRLISEASLESEDSFIVFDTGSESDFDCFDDSDTSDSESETEDETPGHKVRFNLNPTVHNMIKWDFAYRAARHGPWEEMARDRERFRDRITCIGRVLQPVLASDFRTEIWKKRFAARD